MASETERFQRGVLDSHTTNLVYLSDQTIRSRGEPVTVQIPIAGTDNIYHERETTDFNTVNTYLIINWEEYRILSSFSNAEFSESETPLSAVASVSENIPVGSLVTVTVYDPDDTDETAQTIDYRVIKEEVKHERFTYERRLEMVPSRGSSY